MQANWKACLADSRFAGEACNIAGGTEISILELYYDIAAALGAEAEPVFAPAVSGDIRYSCADISKAKNMLGYEPTGSFVEGIKASVEWYKKNM